MAKKFGKFLLFSAVAGAAAYGAYRYLRKEQVLTPVTDEDEDMDFDEDLDGEPTKARSYVNLSFDKERAEDLAKSAVKKAKETISDSVQKVEEFFSDDPTSKVVDAAGVVTEEFINTAEDVAEKVDDVVEDIKDSTAE